MTPKQEKLLIEKALMKCVMDESPEGNGTSTKALVDLLVSFAPSINTQYSILSHDTSVIFPADPALWTQYSVKFTVVPSLLVKYQIEGTAFDGEKFITSLINIHDCGRGVINELIYNFPQMSIVHTVYQERTMIRCKVPGIDNYGILYDLSASYKFCKVIRLN